MDSLISYTSESLLYKYGKVVPDNFLVRLNVYALSSVTLTEPSSRLKFINLDKIINLAFNPDCFIYINFAIEGLEETLKLYFDCAVEVYLPYLKKILSGKVRWRSKYCSDIFSYVNFDINRNPRSNLVGHHERNSDKIFLTPFDIDGNRQFNDLSFFLYDTCESGRILGTSDDDMQFLKKIISTKSNFRVADIYCTFCDLNITNISQMLNDLIDEAFFLLNRISVF